MKIAFRNPFKIERRRGKRSARVMRGDRLMADGGEEALKAYLAVRKTLVSGANTKAPKNDPFELAALMQANGYHARAIRIKVAAAIGRGYTASPELAKKIDRPNGLYSFRKLLKLTTFDHMLHGNHYVSIVKEGGEVALFHQPALKTRVRIDDKGVKTFVGFEYELGLSKLAVVEYPEFEGDGVTEGVRQFALISEEANAFYGDPDYISIKPLLAMNSNIIKSAQLFYKRGLQVDHAIIIETDEEEGLGSEVETDIRAAFNQSFTGIDNARKVLILNIERGDKVSFEKIQSELQEQSTRLMRSDNRDEIAAAHGVPPRALGIISSGSLGGVNEVLGQFVLFKELFVNDHQYEIETWWQQLFEDLGFPDPDSFRLNPMDARGGITMADLAIGVQTGIIAPQEAREEWNTEKGAADLIDSLRALRKELAYGER